MSIWDVASLIGIARIAVGLALVGAIVWLTSRRDAHVAPVSPRPTRRQDRRRGSKDSDAR